MTEEISNELRQPGAPFAESPESTPEARAASETATESTRGTLSSESTLPFEALLAMDAFSNASPAIDAPTYSDEAKPSEAPLASEPSSLRDAPSISIDFPAPREASASGETSALADAAPPDEPPNPDAPWTFDTLMLSDEPPVSGTSTSAEATSDALPPPEAPSPSEASSQPEAPSALESEPLASLPPAPESVSTPAASDGGVRTAMRLWVSALSDMGCVRKNNEDSFGYDEQSGIFAVCDGMGGMASGEIASSRAVAAIVNTFAGSEASGMPVSARLLHSLNVANQDVWQHGQLPENKGMGTTAVVAALDGDKLILGNVGDSRAYVLQGEQCVQLTVDHSYINELIRNGTLTIENAHSADLQGYESVITRAIGVAPEVQPDFYSIDLKPGTVVLLATDGLTRYLLQDEIAAILLASPFERSCANLIDLVKQRGGQDNITCILIVAS